MRWALNKKWETPVFIAIIVAVVFFVYHGLLKTYFQQDEWAGFADSIIAQKQVGIFRVIWNTFWPFHQPAAIELSLGRVLNWLVMYVLYLLFDFKAHIYLVFSMIAHAVNAVLVFFVARKLSKNSKLALLAGIFFAATSVHSQVIQWISASFGSEGSAFFSLVSLLLLSKYVETNQKKYYIYTLIAFFISVGFKESSLFLFFFYPLFDYVLRKKKGEKVLKKLKIHAPFLLLGLIGIGIRFVPFFFAKSGLKYIGAESGHFIFQIIYNLVFYPLEALPQIFVPISRAVDISKTLLEAKFPFLVNNQLAELTIGTEFVSVIGFALFSMALVAFSRYIIRGKESQQKMLVLSVSMIFLSVLPYIVLDKGTAYLDSRYYYLTSIGGALLFGLLAFEIARFLSEKLKASYQKPVMMTLLVFAAIGVLFVHMPIVQKEIKLATEVSTLRKDILAAITDTYPTIDKKTIFYTESDTGYYGLEQHILPFQSGLGQNLMVLYTHSGQVDSRLLNNFYLWGILDEDYKEIEGSGFGYFRNYDKLKEGLQKNKLDLKNVYAFSWNSKSEELKNITENIRQRLWMEVVGKKEITDRSQWEVIATSKALPNVSAPALIDNNLETVWATEESYRKGQFITIDLGKEYDLTEVKQFGTQNLATDGVLMGFRIEVSRDNEIWEPVFEKLPFTPDVNAEVTIAFNPVSTRYVRIKQLGEHNLVLWSLRDISMYSVASSYEDRNK